jgi:transposase
MGHEDYRHGAEAGSQGDQHRAQGDRPDAERYRRVEIITGTERRRRWLAEDKARITAESFAPGVNVSAVARRHGVSIGLLHYWRRRARDSGCLEELRFVPISVSGEAAEAAPPISVAGTIEIDVDGVRIRLSGAVDAVSLRTVLAAVRSGA